MDVAPQGIALAQTLGERDAHQAEHELRNRDHDDHERRQADRRSIRRRDAEHAEEVTDPGCELGGPTGWAGRYGERHPSPVFRASMRGRMPASMMTIMMPGVAGTQSRRFAGNSSQAIAAVIRNGEYDDIAVTCNEDGDLHLSGCVMRGEFFWLRLQNGELQRVVAVNAESFSYSDETIFESQQPIPYVQAYFWENGIVIERGEREGKVYVRDLRDRQFQRN